MYIQISSTDTDSYFENYLKLFTIILTNYNLLYDRQDLGALTFTVL